MTKNKRKQQFTSVYLLFKISTFLSSTRKIQVLGLFTLMLLSGFAELISLTAVIPLLAAFTEPSNIINWPLVRNYCQYNECTSNSIIITLTATFCIVVIITASIRLCNLWLNCKMSGLIGCDLSSDAYKKTLYQPYSTHIEQNSSELIDVITNHVSAVVYAINSSFIAITSTIVAIFLIIGILTIDLNVAISVSITLGIIYLIISKITKKPLKLNSLLISSKSKLRIQLLQEGLGSIRDVILDSTQKTFIETYQEADYEQRKSISQNDFLVSFPRYTLEAIGICFIAGFGGYLTVQNNTLTTLPLLGSIALGAQRLLPALQQIYNGFSTLRGANSSMTELIKVLDQEITINSSRKVKPFKFKQEIIIKGLEFNYKSNKAVIWKNINISINKGDRVGIIGQTGSGKSTFVDVLMGLIPPTRGKVIVDGIDIFDSNNSDILLMWKKAIAHVPQDIFLADCSLAENVAFGIKKNEIDYKRVQEACKKAQISEFIQSKPEGYKTIVGERGILLSGGQKQRIGIARALYKKANLLFFDEATSALDTYTEENLMNSIALVDKDVTIIIVAHRVETLKGCNKIIKFENGVAKTMEEI